MSICPQCGNQNPPGAAFCDNCGASLAGVAPPAPAAPVAPAAPAGGVTCPACGTPVIPGEAFCGNCGAALPAAAPAAPMAPPVQPVTPAPAPAAPVGAMLKCPVCGADQPAGQSFCDNCGASLAAPPQPVQPPMPPVAPPVAPVVPPVWGRPRLVVAGTGAEFDLSGKAEILVGREDPVSGVFPEVDLTPHGGEEGGVSRRHAKLTVRGNQWLVEDLNSTNFTFVNNQKLNPGVPQPLNSGDQVRLGRVVLTFQTT
jgi:predicted nucleic acid-binding Zn ribbon protein